MSKPPLPPHIRHKQRKTRAYTTASITVWVVIITAVAYPFILSAHGMTSDSSVMDSAVVIASTAFIFGSVWASFLTADAWKAYSDYRREMDQLDWETHLAMQPKGQKLLRKILKEEGLL